MRFKKIIILMIIAVLTLNITFVHAADDTGKPIEVNKDNPERIVDFEIETIKGTVIINYKDNNGNILAAQEKKTVEAGKHTYTAKEISGYDLSSANSQTVEIKTNGETKTIYFTYKKIIIVTPKPEPKPEPTPEPKKEEPKKEPTPEPTKEPVKEIVTGTIKGYLLTDKNEPLANKKIELHSNPVSTYTDSKGYFEFKNVELGNHTLYLADENYSKDLVLLKSIVVKENDNVKATLPGDKVLSSLKEKGAVEATQLRLTDTDREKEVNLIVSMKVMGKIIVKYLLNDKVLDEEIMDNLEMGKHVVKAKTFKDYNLVSKPNEKEVELTEETPERTVVVEFKYAAVPPPQKNPAPVWPVPVVIAATLIAAIILYKRKNLKILINDETLAAQGKKEKLVSRKRITAKKEVKVRLDNVIIKAGTVDLKLVFNRAITKKLKNKVVIFENEGKEIGSIEVPENINGEMVVKLKDVINEMALV